MILLDDIVEILALPDGDARLVGPPVVPLNRRGVTATLVNRDLLREPLVFLKSAATPVAVLSWPVVLLKSAIMPVAVWGRHVWARGYLAVSSGNITDEMIQQYIESQEGEPLTDDSRFTIDT
jgi:hypothetical protein